MIKDIQSPPLEQAVIKSLYYLYTELLKEDIQDFAAVMEKAINDCEEIIFSRGEPSQEIQDILLQFSILQRFRNLGDDKKKNVLIHKIELAQTEH